MNKIEALKAVRDGLDVTEDLVRFAREGWKTIADDDKERLKWVGVFHRRPTPGHFMMRIRMPNGILTATQARLLAAITRESGRDIADITTRQQVQLRWVTIEDVPAIIERLDAAGLSSLQTGMDNIRGIVGCPATGLTPRELVETAPIAAAFQRIFLGSKAFSNLPRKFNVTITGCLENCTGPETQDICMTPAVRTTTDGDVAGFNLVVGGKQGSGGPTFATVLDAFERLWQRGDTSRLILVGREGFGSHVLTRRLSRHPERGSRLVWLQDASDADLEVCYRHAAALINASTSEGFGLPIVEALHRGIAVIASDIPVFREVGGSEVVYVPPGDVEAWAAAIEAIERAPARHAPSAPRYARSWAEATRELIGQLIES